MNTAKLETLIPKPMKLWRIPHRWDWHAQGAYIVMAATKAEAITKVQAIEANYKKKNGYDRFGTGDEKDPAYEEIVQLKNGVYTDGGCDD